MHRCSEEANYDAHHRTEALFQHSETDIERVSLNRDTSIFVDFLILIDNAFDSSSASHANPGPEFSAHYLALHVD